MLDEKNKEFAYAFLADRESYHTHKENSAYTVFLVETGLFGALVTTDVVPKFVDKSPGWILVVLVFIVWSLLHVFMRWQLINRRIAALQVGTVINALTDYLNNRTLSRVTSTHSECCVGKYLDFIIPCIKSTYQGDIELHQYPEWYRLRYVLMWDKGTKAGFGEVFPTVGSLFMLLISLVSIYLHLQ